MSAIRQSVRYFFLLSFLAHLFLAAASTCSAEERTLSAAAGSITGAELKRHAEVLADDTFEGRESGSRGGRAAAGYIAQRLSDCGLQPAGTGKSWYQVFGGRYRNVLARVGGADSPLAEEVILLGAHYDHVGYGNSSNSYGPTGYIHNGADDNASGVAALLELAQSLEMVQPPARTIVLAFWDGEEQGLLGSRHWVQQPTFPLDRVALLVNLDMVGRLRNNRLEVSGSRTAVGLRRMASEATAGTALELTFPWKIGENSDHWPFFQRRVPYLMLHTGLHGDYHRPSDDVDKLNVEGMESITRMLLQLSLRLANRPEPIRFRSASQSEGTAQRKALYRLPPSPPSRLGVAWKAGQQSSQPGVRVSRVLRDSPADRAGLRVGDQIVRFAAQPIATGDDLLAAVATAPVETTAEVQREDESEPQSLQLRLAGQPTRVGITWRVDPANPHSVLLVRVIPGSPAHRAGLQPLDRIYQFNGQDLTSSADLLADLHAATTATLRVERRGQLRQVELQLPEPVDVTPRDDAEDSPLRDDAEKRNSEETGG